MIERILVFLDIDGTISDYGSRIAKALPEPSKANPEVYNAWLKDLQPPEVLYNERPVPGMVVLAQSLALNPAIKLYYLTARDENYRHITESWLFKNGFPPSRVIMMDPKDMRHSSEYKIETINKYSLNGMGWSTILIDDDPHNTLEKLCLESNITLLKAITYKR